MLFRSSSILSPSEKADGIGSQTCPNACSKASKDIVSMFTRVVAQHVTETLCKDPIKSGKTDLSSSSKVSDDPCHSASMAPKYLLPPMPPSNHERLCSTVNILVVRIITKISRSVKSAVILNKMAADLTEQILKRCRDGTQLGKMESCLQDMNLTEIDSSVRKALLREFGTREALQRAMTSEDPTFGKTLVGLLTDALLSCKDGGKKQVPNQQLKPVEKVSYFSKLSQKRKMVMDQHCVIVSCFMMRYIFVSDCDVLFTPFVVKWSLVFGFHSSEKQNCTQSSAGPRVDG